MSRIVILTLFAVALTILASAQATDTAGKTTPSDSFKVQKNGEEQTIESYASNYDPRKAMLYSAVLPGLGQAYNRAYWKIPLVYGGFAGFGYGIWWNQERYIFYRNGLFGLLNEPATPVVNPETGLTVYGNRVINGVALFPASTSNPLKLEVVRNAVNRYRRDRDFMLVMTFVFYMMQMVEAHVDAHLKEFELNPKLNPKLRVSLEPTMQQNAFTGRSAGFGVTLKF